jgi:CubicO group peptidase (beta-lactamase class C family)
MAAALIAAVACPFGSPGRAESADGPPPAQAVWPMKTWIVTTPEEQGLDSGALARLVESVGSFKQDSLQIVRHGKLVLDVYYAPYRTGIAHDLRSVTKSIIGTLTAIELRDGLLDSVDHPILDLFSDSQISNIDDNKKAMTVQNLLDMNSGIDWQEQIYIGDETIVHMYQSPDPTEFVLRQPMADPPGTKFYYNSGNPYVLSALITKKTGHNAFDYAKSALFEPLGITSAHWGRLDDQGVMDGESGLFLTPLDMARIGYLYLQNGLWDGKQIIPSSWVDRVRAGPVTATGGFHYANLWWSIPEKDAFMALGRHSQFILVLPKLDIVAVMTGTLRDDEYYSPSRLIGNIARAVVSDSAVPADPIAQSLLAAAIGRAATERPIAVGKTAKLAAAISGKTYQLKDNALKITSLSLRLSGPKPSVEMTAGPSKGAKTPRRFSYPIGLDGLSRNSLQDNHEIEALRGRWLTEHSFEIDDRTLGGGETAIWDLTFDGRAIDVVFRNTDGFRAELHGETPN